MRTLKILCLILSVSTVSVAQADLVEDITREPASSDEVVVDESYLQETNWTEPLFNSRGIQRDVARSLDLSSDDLDGEWSGDLAVQAEIPFTYPVVTRLTLQKRALNELEAQEAR